MKKLLLIIITIFYISNSFGQEKKIAFGLKIGVNYVIPSYLEKWHIEFDGKTNANFGVFINYSLTDKFIIRPELIYSIQNLNYETELGTISGYFPNKGIQKESFLNFPILIKYSLNDKFSFIFGPQLGFIMNTDVRFVIEKDSLYYIKPTDKFNFSGNVGFSYEITKKFYTELRYNFGLTELNGFKNSVVQLNLDLIIF